MIADWTGEWELPDDLTAAGAARHAVLTALAELGIAGVVADDVVLIASELAANAVRHGRPPILLRLVCDADRVTVAVSNHGDSPDPRVLTADPESGHGRGLAMVEQLASEVGWSRAGDRLDVWAAVLRERSKP